MVIHRALFIAFALLALVLASCTREVTNHVPGSNLSTPQSPTGSQPPQASTQGGSSDPDSSGGVINGGGGKGVLCKKDGKQTVDVLDLYEARVIHNQTIVDLGDSEEAAMDKVALILARHLWSPPTVEVDQYAKALKEFYLKDFLKNIRFVAKGKKLRLTNDSFDPILDEDCVPVQIAVYYDESVLLVNKVLWDQLNWTKKMALIAHEVLYFIVRQYGVTNSMSVRKLIGMLFSPKGVRPLADGIPTDSSKYLTCELSSEGFLKGSFYLYRSKNPKGASGLEMVFFHLAQFGSLFRTSSFFTDLSFVDLQFPNFNGSRQASLLRDTYPLRDQTGLTFKGIANGNLKADLRILTAGANPMARSYDVSCQIPSNFQNFAENETEPGEYETLQPDGFVDRLTIHHNGSLTLERTRQVSRNGTNSDFGNIPYPTVCRYKELGIIEARDANTVTYRLQSGELTSQEGLKENETKNCPAYIEAFNKRASTGDLRFTIPLKDFKKVK